MILEKVTNAINQCMKLKNENKKNSDDAAINAEINSKMSALTVLKSKLLLLEKENKGNFTIKDIYTVLKKEIEDTENPIEDFIKGKREDLIEDAKIKIKVLSEFLADVATNMPKQLDENEIIKEVVKFAKGLNLSNFTMKEKGLFMKNLKVTLAEIADMKDVDKSVSTFLKNPSEYLK